MTETQLGPSTESSASIHLEISKVYTLMKKPTEAFGEHTKSIEIYRQFENVDLIPVAENAESLSMLLQVSNIPATIECISQAIDIYDNAMGTDNKTSAKLRRRLSLLFLKAGKNADAMGILKQVEKTERAIFGEFSLKLAQTFKEIGKVNEILGNKDEAHNYYSKALEIVVKRKKPLLIKEVKSLLRVLSNK